MSMDKKGVALKILERIQSKAAQYKEQGYADTSYEKQIDKKYIVMNLPNSVFEQQKLLLLGDTVFNADNNNYKKILEVTKEFNQAICKRILIDNMVVDCEVLSLAELQKYTLLYWVELLAPLSHWSDMSVADLF